MAISIAVPTAPVALARIGWDGRTITSLTDAIKVQIWLKGGNGETHNNQQQQNYPDVKGPLLDFSIHLSSNIHFSPQDNVKKSRFNLWPRSIQLGINAMIPYWGQLKGVTFQVRGARLLAVTDADENQAH